MGEDRISQLEDELAEVHAELDRLGAAPGLRAQARLRGARWILAEEADLRAEEARRQPYRRRLPDEREGVTHKFSVGGHEGYLILGLFEDGTPGEMFFRIAKEGSTIKGLLDNFAIAVSLALQWGAPLESLCDKFEGQAFPPDGHTDNPDITPASSIVDYVFRYLRRRFLGLSAEEQVREVDRRARGEAAAALEASLQFAPKNCLAAMTAALDLLRRGAK